MQTKKTRLTPSRQAKNKRSTKETLETLQGDNAKEIWKHLLYLSPDGFIGSELAYGTPLGEGEFRSLLEVRLTRLAPTVLQLQYKQGRDGSGLLPKNVDRNRGRKNGTASKR